MYLYVYIHSTFIDRDFHSGIDDYTLALDLPNPTQKMVKVLTSFGVKHHFYGWKRMVYVSVYIM